jgi:hypothetical protein
VSAAPEQRFQTSSRDVKTVIAVPPEMSVRKTDWKRIYRKTKSIPRPTSVYQIVASSAWSIAASALVALVPLYQATTGLESWVKPTFWAAAVACVAVGALALWFDRERHSLTHASCQEVLQDLQETYQSFFPDETLDASTKVPEERVP